jgi:hypothetical protein
VIEKETTNFFSDHDFPAFSMKRKKPSKYEVNARFNIIELLKNTELYSKF